MSYDITVSHDEDFEIHVVKGRLRITFDNESDQSYLECGDMEGEELDLSNNTRNLKAKLTQDHHRRNVVSFTGNGRLLTSDLYTKTSNTPARKAWSFLQQEFLNEANDLANRDTKLKIGRDLQGHMHYIETPEDNKVRIRGLVEAGLMHTAITELKNLARNEPSNPSAE